MGRLRNALRALRGAPLPEPVPGGSFVVGPTGPFDTNPKRTKKAQADSTFGWVRAATSLISEDVGAIDWWFEDSQGEEINAPEPTLLLRKPTAWTTWCDLVEATQLNLDLTGEGFWWLVGPPGGAIQAIQHVPSTWVTQALTPSGVFVGWNLQIPGHAPQVVNQRDLVWFKCPHPTEPWRALSPVEAFALSYDMDLYARAYGAALLKNWAQPPGLLSSDQELSAEEAELIRARWKASRQEAENIAVLGKGATYTPLSISIKDLAFIELARMTREQILAIYRVPPGKLGLAEEGGTAAEHSARDNSYAKNCLAPRLYKLSTVINAYVVPRLFNAVDTTRVRFAFDNPVQRDEAFDLTKAEQGLKSGVITINQYLSETGRDPLPPAEGDLYMLPTGVTLVATLSDGLSTVIQPEPFDEEDEDAEEEDASEGQGQEGQERLLIPATVRSQWLPEGLIPGLTTKDMDEAEGRYLGRQARNEVKLRGDVRRILTREGKAVAESIRAGEMRGATVRMVAGEGQLFEQSLVFETRDVIDDILARYASQWLRTLEEHNRRGLEDGWELFERDAHRTLLSFDVFQPQAHSIAAAQAGAKVKDITKTTSKAVRKTIANGIAEGTSIPDLARQVEALYEGWRGTRAETIARTDTAYAINKGRDEHAQSAEQRLGVRIYNTWLAVSDDRTRDHHAEAHGQRVRHGEYFDVGGHSLLFPGDSENGAPAEETINCRCTTASEVIDD